MTRSFYKCRVPRTKRYLSNGAVVNFTDIGRDEGLFSTEDEFVSRELDGMIAEGRGGVFKISAEEYQELKKNRISPQTWREELGKSGHEVNRQPTRASSLASPLNPLDQGRAAEASLAAVEAAPQVASAPTAEPARPTATKRK